VWVADKREDINRKLTNRLTREMQVMSPENAYFVIITSDQDFRQHFQLLRNAGFGVIAIHNASSPKKWKQVFMNIDMVLGLKVI
jgi:hypothetical protein